jgi:hypothetical protein
MNVANAIEAHNTMYGLLPFDSFLNPQSLTIILQSLTKFPLIIIDNADIVKNMCELNRFLIFVLLVIFLCPVKIFKSLAKSFLVAQNQTYLIIRPTIVQMILSLRIFDYLWCFLIVFNRLVIFADFIEEHSNSNRTRLSFFYKLFVFVFFVHKHYFFERINCFVDFTVILIGFGNRKVNVGTTHRLLSINFVSDPQNTVQYLQCFFAIPILLNHRTNTHKRLNATLRILPFESFLNT